MYTVIVSEFLYWVIIMSLIYSDFNLLSLQLKQSLDFLKSCRINEENKGLFSHIDKAIDIGKGHYKLVDGLKELQIKNVDLDRFQIMINKSCSSVEAYISEVDKIKSIAN